MEVIIHRVNDLKRLGEVPKICGAEIDLRAYGSQIVLHHDPFIEGILFTDFLENYNHGTLVLNVKESGIESEVLRLVKKYEVAAD